MVVLAGLAHAFLLFTIFTVAGANKCLTPSIRREWRSLLKQERAEWITAVKCLAKLPHDPALTPMVNPSVSMIPPVNTSSSYYDDIVYMHMDLNEVIHFTGQFLPWHRAYVLGFERALKEKCNYLGAHPYWDWTKDAPDFYHGTIFDSDPESGLGGWGDQVNDYQINSGGFSDDFPVAYPSPHTIRRNFTLQPFLGLVLPPDGPPVDTAEMINKTFTAENVQYMIESFVGDYTGFQSYFEGLPGPHAGPHLILGGDMTGLCPKDTPKANCATGPKWTPNDPLFFLHHAMIDKVWSDWQHRHPQNFWAYAGGSVPTITDFKQYVQFPNGAPSFMNFNSQVPGDNLLWKNLTVWDLMDTTGDGLCYIYQ